MSVDVSQKLDIYFKFIMGGYKIECEVIPDLILTLEEFCTTNKIGTYKRNGLTGAEIVNYVIPSLELVLNLLGIWIAYDQWRREKNSSKQSQEFITIVDPDGFEYLNVPISKLAEVKAAISNSNNDVD